MAPKKRNEFFTKLKKKRDTEPDYNKAAIPGSAFDRIGRSNTEFDAHNSVTQNNGTNTALPEITRETRAVNAARQRIDRLSGRAPGRVAKPKSKRRKINNLRLPDSQQPTLEQLRAKPKENWRACGGYPMPVSNPASSTLAVARIPPFLKRAFVSGFTLQLNVLVPGVETVEVFTRERSLGGGEEGMNLFVMFEDVKVAEKVMGKMQGVLVDGRIVQMGFAVVDANGGVSLGDPLAQMQALADGSGQSGGDCENGNEDEVQSDEGNDEENDEEAGEENGAGNDDDHGDANDEEVEKDDDEEMEEDDDEMEELFGATSD